MPIRSTEGNEESSPLLLLGIVFFLVICLLVFSGSRSGEETDPAAKAPGGAGGAGTLMVPGAPLDGVVGSPVPDAPPYTIVDDIRQTMKRIPDRNLPKGWPNPVPK